MKISIYKYINSIKFLISLLSLRSAIRLSNFFFKKYVLRITIPHLADLAVTYRCPCRCNHCSAGIFEKNQNEEMSTNDWINIIEILYRMGIPRLYFLGGEPFVREDLLSIVEFTARKGFLVFVETNGFFLSSDIIIKLKKSRISCLNISLDSGNQNEFDIMRGVNGLYKNIIDSLTLCKKINLNCIISTFASRDNIRTGRLKEVIKIGERFNVPVRISPAYPSGRWLFNAEEIYLDSNDLKRLNVYLDTFIPIINKTKEKECLIKKGYSIFIDPYGEIYPCPFLPFSFGNIKKESICQIFFRMINHEMFKLRSQCYIKSQEFRSKYTHLLKPDIKYPVKCYKIH